MRKFNSYEEEKWSFCIVKCINNIKKDKIVSQLNFIYISIDFGLLFCGKY